MSPTRGASLMLMATLLAALGWLASKAVIHYLPPALFIGSRFLVAALLLLPLCWRELLRYPLGKLARLALLGGFLSISIMLWITAVGASEGLGEGAFIMTLAMLFAPLLHWGLFKQAPTPAFWLAFPLALGGLALLSLDDGFQPSASQILYVLAAGMLSLHFTLNQRFSTQGQEVSSPLGRVCVQLFAVGVVTSLWSLLTETLPQPLWTSFADALPWFAVSVLLATSLRYWCQLSAQARLAPATAALMMLLEPLWTLGLSLVFLNEVLAVNKLGGCGLILMALLVQRGAPSKWIRRISARAS